MRVVRPALSVILLAPFLASVNSAQNTDPNNDTGLHEYQTYDGAHENISLGTGNVFVSIPLLTLRGRNGHNYSVSLMSNSQTWSPNANWINSNVGMVLTRTGDIYFHPGGMVSPASGVRCIGNYAMSDEMGGVHTFSNIQTNCMTQGQNGYVPAPSYNVMAGGDDRGEGITADINACMLYFRNGNSVPLLSGSSGCPTIGTVGTSVSRPTLEDSNGNEIYSGAYSGTSGTYGVHGGGDLFPSGTDTDTVGRSINYSPNAIQYRDSSGVQRSITLNTQTLTLSCTFAYPGTGASQPSGTPNVIASAILPNGLTYIFQYDGCGNLTKIVYPSGGYTRYILDYSHYTHGVQGLTGGPFTYIEVVKKYVCRAAAAAPGATSTGTGNTCPISEDLTTYTPTMSSCGNSATTVVDPLGNTTAYQFANSQVTPCGFYSVLESQRQVYQGSSTLLGTVQTAISGDYPLSKTTILPNGLRSQIQWDYWALDLVKEKREYGWGQGAPGALMRKTDHGSYCDAKMPNETVYDGSGNQLASTTYEFDNYTTGISSSGAVQHDSNYGTGFTARCNVTAIQRWRNTDGATLTTRMQYDDAGNVLSATDPLNHTTTTSYADVWGNNACAPSGGNTAAYPTQVTDPAGLTTKHSYNSCTGTVATSTDQNLQITNLAYDLMDRLSQTNLPDGGQTTNCFSEVSGGSCYSNSFPLNVVATKKVTASLNTISTTVLDGLARVTETQLNSDPDCTTPSGVKTDTTYDSDERKSTLSNPYCTNGDATYGVTTYQYDALNRVTTVIPPDGTTSSNNVSKSYDLAKGTTNCATVTDQAGAVRQSCADGLGRLVEVDEPGSSSSATSGTGSATVNGSEQSIGGTPATPGTGSATFNGSLQSKQVQTQAATAGTGSVTISGSDSSYTFDPCAQSGHGSCPQTIWDGGTIAVTVNGVQAGSTGYGNNTTSSLATALASSINGNSSSPVTASASGSTVYLTAKTTGSSTNYSLSASSYTQNTQYFSGTSFPVSTSGSTLTGGQNASYTTVYDSGTCTITVNSHGDPTSWSGSGTTTSSIASALASSINGDGSALVSSSASGSTVNLTAKSTGAATNYSLSSSCTYDTSHFSSPSFSTSNSGSTLTGGSNGSATIYDSGTVWIKVAGYQASISYGQSDTPTTLATSLAGVLNAAASPVTASVSGAAVSLTAKATGANTNFTLSAGSSTSQPGNFSQPSFSVSLSGSTLTGGSSPTLSLSTPAVTAYAYDALNNLLAVTQSTSRQRTFAYDSLSHLLSAANPESGTVTYSYDNDGNVITKTAPKPNQPSSSVTVQMTFSYDNDNRVTQKNYNDGVTPTVKFAYDGNTLAGCATAPPVLGDGYPKGYRTAMCDGAGAESWSHDTMGRILTDSRITNGVTKSTVYAYSPYLDGSINTVTYPSGRVMTYTLASSGTNTAERLGSVQDNSTSVYYATGAHYTPTGGLSSLTNGSSLISSLYYNNRLQPCRIAVKSSGSAPASCVDTTVANVLDYTYGFNLGSADNGNVTSIANNRDTTRSQSFTYDALNRLASAQTTSIYSTSAVHCWGEAFGFDPWGNLLSVSESSSSYDGCTSEQPQAWTMQATNQIQSTATCFDTNGNLLTTSTYCYDAAGNLLTDTAKSYTYNAENQVNSVPMLGISYQYDGDGKRVMKSNGTLYWYGMSGDALDETDSAGNTNNSGFFEYIFFGGKRIARRDYQNNVNYYFSDHLGTSRVVTNSSGSILDDSDFYPFGGERAVASSSGNHYKFTGKERDPESGLDNFGVRYNSSSLGRFMSPDSIANDWELRNPQTWNRYAYARNNPLIYVDPDGAAVELICTCLNLNQCKIQREKELDLFKAAIGNNEAASRLYINEVKDGDNTRYFVGIMGDATDFTSGKLGDNVKEFGKLVTDKRIVEFGLTDENLAFLGGAATFDVGEHGNQHPLVLVNPDQAVALASERTMLTFWNRSKFAGQWNTSPPWIVQPFTLPMVAWHELGHGWAKVHSEVKDQEGPKWENRVREQLYGPLGPKNAPRDKD